MSLQRNRVSFSVAFVGIPIGSLARIRAANVIGNLLRYCLPAILLLAVFPSRTRADGTLRLISTQTLTDSGGFNPLVSPGWNNPYNAYPLASFHESDSDSVLAASGIAGDSDGNFDADLTGSLPDFSAYTADQTASADSSSLGGVVAFNFESKSDTITDLEFTITTPQEYFFSADLSDSSAADYDADSSATGFSSAAAALFDVTNNDFIHLSQITSENSTINTDNGPVSFSESGVLPPGNYELDLEAYASSYGALRWSSSGSSSVQASFSLTDVPEPSAIALIGSPCRVSPSPEVFRHESITEKKG